MVSWMRKGWWAAGAALLLAGRCSAWAAEQPERAPEQRPPVAAEQTETDEPAATLRPAGPQLVVSGVRALEILPRSYDETLRFYMEVLGFREVDAAGGEGERRSVLAAGPVRLRVREQPGRPVRPRRFSWLGVYPAALSAIAARSAGVKETGGVLVEDVAPQGPAAAAGILKGDVILSVEGKETATPDRLIAVVRGFPPGKKVLVTLWREGRKRDLPVELLPSPFPEQIAPVVVRLEVRDLDSYYRELLRRGIRVYAEPRDAPDGGRVLELVDPNDVMVILEEPGVGDGNPSQPPPAPSGSPPAVGGDRADGER